MPTAEKEMPWRNSNSGLNGTNVNMIRNGEAYIMQVCQTLKPVQSHVVLLLPSDHIIFVSKCL